jgi:hypothetical protein
LLHQVGDLFELNVKFRCQKVKEKYLEEDMVLNMKMGNGKVGRIVN